MQVKDIMQQAYVLEEDITLQQAAKLLSSKRIGSLLFVKKKKLMGMITDSDVLKNYNKEGKISKIMTKQIYTVTPEDSLHDALSVMRQHQVKHAPVVENGQLVGIITLTDLAAHLDDYDGDFFFN